MKHLLLTTIAAVLVVGCGEAQQSSTPLEAEPVEPVAEVPAQSSPPPVEAQPPQPVGEVPVQDAKAANSQANRALMAAARDGNIEAIKQQLAAGADVNATDDKGLTAFDWFKDEETAELLRKHGGKTKRELKAEGK